MPIEKRLCMPAVPVLYNVMQPFNPFGVVRISCRSLPKPKPRIRHPSRASKLVNPIETVALSLPAPLLLQKQDFLPHCHQVKVSMVLPKLNSLPHPPHPPTPLSIIFNGLTHRATYSRSKYSTYPQDHISTCSRVDASAVA